MNFPDLTVFQPIFSTYAAGNRLALKNYDITKYVGVHLACLKLILSLTFLRNISCDKFQLPDLVKRFSLFHWDYDEYASNRALNIVWFSKHLKQYSSENLKSYKYYVDMHELENVIMDICNAFIFKKSLKTVLKQLNKMKSFEDYYSTFEKQRKEIYQLYLECFAHSVFNTQHKGFSDKHKKQNIDFISINYYKSAYECNFELQMLNQKIIVFEMAEKKLADEIQHYKALIHRETMCLDKIIRAYLKENDALVDILEAFDHEYLNKRDAVANQQRLLKKKLEQLEATWIMKKEEMDFFKSEISEYFRRINMKGLSTLSSHDAASDALSHNSKTKKRNKKKKLLNSKIKSSPSKTKRKIKKKIKN